MLHMQPLRLIIVMWPKMHQQVQTTSWPCAVNGSAVSSMCSTTFLGTDLATATPGVEQNRPVLTLHTTHTHTCSHENQNKCTKLRHTLLPLKCASFPWPWGIWTPSKTWFMDLQSTTPPNWLTTGSAAIFTQYTGMSNIHTCTCATSACVAIA